MTTWRDVHSNAALGSLKIPVDDGVTPGGGYKTTAELVLPGMAGSHARPVAPLKYLGVNIEGLSFNPQALPGTAGTDYFPPSTNTLNYWASKGANCHRLCFLWEREQPTLNAALDPTHLGYLTSYVAAAAAKNTTVILDLHNYARYNQTLFGTAPVTQSALVDLWTRLATAFAATPNVIFGLMNEPETSDTVNWLAAVNAMIAAIRQAGATTQLILAPAANGGNLQWLGLAGFDKYPGFSDPNNNTAIDIHRYFDGDASGQAPVAAGNEFRPIVDFGAAVGWARRNGQKLFFSEFSFSTGPSDLLAMDNALAFLQRNSDVVVGATLWGGCEFWPNNYVYHLEPIGGVDQPQVAIMQRYLPGGAEYGVARPRGGQKLTQTTLAFSAANCPAYLQAISAGHGYTDAQIYVNKREMAVSGTFSLTSATPVGSDTIQALIGYLLGVCVFVDGSGKIGFGYQQYDIPSATNSTYQQSSTVSVIDGAEHTFLAWVGQAGGGLYVDGVSVLTSNTCWNPDWKSAGIFCHYTGDRLMNSTALGRDFVVWTDLNAALAAGAQNRSFQPFQANVPGVLLHVPCGGDLRTFF